VAKADLERLMSQNVTAMRYWKQEVFRQARRDHQNGRDDDGAPARLPAPEHNESARHDRVRQPLGIIDGDVILRHT